MFTCWRGATIAMITMVTAHATPWERGRRNRRIGLEVSEEIECIKGTTGRGLVGGG